MNIDPAYSTAIQLSASHEFDGFPVRNRANSINAIVGREQINAASAVAQEQLARDQIVRRHLVERKQLFEVSRMRIFARQEADPDRAIDQHHLGGRRGFNRVFAETRHIFCFGLAASQSPEPLVSGAPNQAFKAETNRFGVGGCATRRLGGTEEFIVDIQRFLHAVIVPYFRATCLQYKRMYGPEVDPRSEFWMSSALCRVLPKKSPTIWYSGLYRPETHRYYRGVPRPSEKAGLCLS